MAFDHAAYVKTERFRQVQRDYERKRKRIHPEQHRAKKIIYNLVHYKDYSKPRNVTWLCKQCHIDTHMGKTALRCPTK